MRESYRAAWLTRLQQEYDEICAGYGVFMQPPVFEIAGGKRQLGCWRKGTRCLCISSQLIESHPWNVVLQVLKHEMAHQYCDEVRGGAGPVHGDEFQRACEMLGVLPEFRNPAVITEEMLAALVEDRNGTSRSGRIFAKVEKLLALGASPHIHEAELALQKAQELIAKYQLESLTENGVSDYQVLVINTGKKQIATYKRYICRILQDFFNVRVVLSSLYIAQEDTSHKTIELLGTKENARVGEYCYHFLENQLEMLWKAYRKKTKVSGRTSKNSFYIGVVLGFLKKLESEKFAAIPVAGSERYGALLVVEEQRLDHFVQMHFPRLSRASSRRSTVDSRSYNEGLEAGQAMNFNQGLNGGQVKGGRLLS